jgi:hypothetical protein
MRPLTFEARLMGLERVLGIRAACDGASRATCRPEIDLINAEEEARIRELIAMETGCWAGTETSRSPPPSWIRCLQTALCGHDYFQNASNEAAYFICQLCYQKDVAMPPSVRWSE